jgi:hypothetical protein
MPTVDAVPPAADPLGLLKWLFTRTKTPIPAALKSSLAASSTHPNILIFKELVVAIVETAKVPDDIPVVVLPLVAVAKFAFANTPALAVALLVHVASVATTNI